MKLNINTKVKVVLTEYGKQIADEYYKKVYSNAEGMTPQSYQMYRDSIEQSLIGEFSLWKIMHIFGPVIYIGNPKVPFENNQIKILDILL